MKKILTALLVTAFACYGAEAQVCKAKVIHKHKATTAALPGKGYKIEPAMCRAVPYEACHIMPDRRTVSCYKTMDLDNLTPMNDEVTYYGPTGKMPGRAEPQPVETVVVKGEPKKEYCKRDEANKTTTCTYVDRFYLVRDADGYYHYR